MLDPKKMTVQYQNVLRRHPTKWFFLSPTEPKLDWGHHYKKVRQPGTIYLPETFPSHPVRHRFAIEDVSTAHFKFASTAPHDVYINIISGQTMFRIDDDGTAYLNGAHRLQIYNAKLPVKNGIIYQDYPQLSKRHNDPKNLHIMMLHLCEFTDMIMSLVA